MATLGYNQTNALSSTALPELEAHRLVAGLHDRHGEVVGHARHSAPKIWTIYGKGFVTNPIANAVDRHAHSSRRRCRSRFSYSQPVNTQAWNYIYLTNTGRPDTSATSCSQQRRVRRAALHRRATSASTTTRRSARTSRRRRSRSASSSRARSPSRTARRSASARANTVAPGLHRRRLRDDADATSTRASPGADVGLRPALRRTSGGFSTVAPTVTPPIGRLGERRLVCEREPRADARLHDVERHAAAVRQRGRPRTTRTQNLTAPYANGSAGDDQPDARRELYVQDDLRRALVERGDADDDDQRRRSTSTATSRSATAASTSTTARRRCTSRATSTISGTMCGKRNAAQHRL